MQAYIYQYTSNISYADGNKIVLKYAIFAKAPYIWLTNKEEYTKKIKSKLPNAENITLEGIYTSNEEI